MKYNNKKKIRIKTVQINNKELEKCKSGKEFKVRIISRSGTIIVDPPRPTLRDLVMKIDARLERVEAVLDEHGRAISRLEENDKKIFDILNRNNLH